MLEQILHANITWRECAELPISLVNGKTVVNNGKVYYGGGVASSDNDQYNVYCYDPMQDKWTTLPPLPVRYFGLGQFNGKLVAVGGEKNFSSIKTKEVYTYDERSRKWKQTIPPMPTARRSPSVLSLELQPALLVVGGCTPLSYMATTEIFKPDKSQWHKTDPLPTACYDISLVETVTTGSTCYALGGYNGSYLSQVFYASVEELLHNAMPANQTTYIRSREIQSAWKVLPNTSTYQPAAAVLAGKLLAIGGKETYEGGASKKEVYMYSFSTNSWIYIGDLPVPRSNTTIAVLSSMEILVMGGWNGSYCRSAYKGTLYLK